MKQASKPILRYPRLDTVLMVERFIKKHDGEFKKKALWQALPKKMMYQTYCVIIDYLLGRKISIDAEGKIGWIYYPETARYYAAREDLSVENFLTPEQLRIWRAKANRKALSTQGREATNTSKIHRRRNRTRIRTVKARGRRRPQIAQVDS